MPPLVASERCVTSPWHTCSAPVIAAGSGFTVTVAVVPHPSGNVYKMFAVPAATPVTIPVDKPIVATPVLPLSHVPPPASLSTVVAPTHTFSVPVIGAAATTVITAVT